MSVELALEEHRLDQLRLTAVQRRQLASLLAVLQQDERAPTAVREPHEAVRAHVADSLVALELAQVRAARRLADLGSGAGFPGLALAVALPAAEASLVESQRRRCDFLRRACIAAEITNVRVVCARAEDWRGGLGRCDLVTARALAPQPVVLEYAAPLLRVGGWLVDWRGARVAAEEQASACAAQELGLRLEEIRAVRPFAQAKQRNLHLYLKVSDTPERFPRRAGMARKRPLAG